MIETKKLDNEITLYTVSNGTISFSAMNYGCTITNLFVPAKNGEKTDILLVYDTLEGWKAGTSSHNAIVGRGANRIAGAKFTLDGKEYLLDKNDGKNCLHGGNTRWEKMLWNAEKYSDSEGEGVKFARKSADGEQGMPGNLDLCVIYKLTEKNELVFEYTATSDKATPINLTNHAYFNLNGKGSILNHHLPLDSGRSYQHGLLCSRIQRERGDPAARPEDQHLCFPGTCRNDAQYRTDYRTHPVPGTDDGKKTAAAFQAHGGPKELSGAEERRGCGRRGGLSG